MPLHTSPTLAKNGNFDAMLKSAIVEDIGCHPMDSEPHDHMLAQPRSPCETPGAPSPSARGAVSGGLRMWRCPAPLRRATKIVRRISRRDTLCVIAVAHRCEVAGEQVRPRPEPLVGRDGLHVGHGELLNGCDRGAVERRGERYAKAVKYNA